MRHFLNYFIEISVFLGVVVIKTSFDLWEVVKSNYLEAKDAWTQEENEHTSSYGTKGRK